MYIVDLIILLLIIIAPHAQGDILLVPLVIRFLLCIGFK